MDANSLRDCSVTETNHAIDVLCIIIHAFSGRGRQHKPRHILEGEENGVSYSVLGRLGKYIISYI